MKLSLNDLGKTFKFELLNDGKFISMKGVLSFDEEELRCELDNIELLSHKDEYSNDYFTCLYYDRDNMGNFKEEIK